MRTHTTLLGCLALMLWAAPGQAAGSRSEKEHTMSTPGTESIFFGAGCFWCTEAAFALVPGVSAVTVGYQGGSTPDPSYHQVCSGSSGHAEVARVDYDPSGTNLDQLFDVFWTVHDPTTLNRQGADVGTQYRSVIFPHTGEQRRVAEEMKAALDASGAFPAPIVTSLEPLGAFHPAESYHHDYYARNGSQGYCAYVIAPKLEKFRKAFADRLKPSGDEAAG